MGVDTWIDSRSLAHCPQAKCRAFRSTANQPIIYWQKRLDEENENYHYLIPVESFPLPIQVLDPKIELPRTFDENYYAVEIITVKINNKRQDQLRRFNRWISQQEYQTIISKFTRQVEGHDRWTLNELLKWNEEQEICDSCPLKLTRWKDCSASLFSYSTLHEYRHAMGVILTRSPDRNTEIQSLLEALINIFPNETEEALLKNSSAMYVTGIIDLIREYVPTWKPETIPDEQTSQIADTMLNLIFFRDSEDPEYKWLFGTRLGMLTDWLERLNALIVKSDDQSEYIVRLGRLMDDFLEWCKIAYKYNLKIAISF